MGEREKHEVTNKSMLFMISIMVMMINKAGKHKKQLGKTWVHMGSLRGPIFIFRRPSWIFAKLGVEMPLMTVTTFGWIYKCVAVSLFYL